jgi:hypothetical protein
MRKTFATLLALLILGFQLPLSASAAGSITARSMVAGIGGSVSFSGFQTNAAATLSLRGPNGEQFALPLSFDGRGNGTVTLPGERMLVAGSCVINVVSNGSTIANASLEVLPDTVDPSRSTVSVDRKTFAPDGRDTAIVTAVLQDKFGNPLASRPITFIPSRSDVTLRMQANVTDAKGSIAGSIITKNPGAVTIRVFDLLSAETLDATATLMAIDPMLAQAVGGYQDDGTYNGVPQNQAVYPQYPMPYAPYPYIPYGSPYNASLFYNPYNAQLAPSSVVDHFDVQLNNVSPMTNDALNLTVTARDRQNNVVEDYVGDVVVFSPTDPTATMPGSGLTDSGEGKLSFLGRNRGVVSAVLSVVFRRGGPQTIRVEDRKGAQPIAGELTVTVRGPDVIPEANRINVTTPKKNAPVRSATLNVEGDGPKFSNLRVKILGGAEDSFFGESDASGHFSIPVTLKSGVNSFVLRVQSEPNGKFDSGDIPFTLKTSAPQVQSVTYAPEKPQENDSVLVTLLTEAGDKVVMKISGQEIPMAENAGKPGTYQVGITAPAPGKYQPIFTITDPAGNVTQERGSFEVRQKGLQKVEGLTAEARSKSVFLSWKPLTGATSYRVYVGTAADNFLAIDTNQAVTSALIKDLEPATLYYFAVTAINGERESAEKSDIVTATPQGLKLKVTPEVSALRLQWDLPTQIELSAFVLEYGVDEKKLTERRLINAELRDYALRDLLPEVTYFVRVTPVTVEGNVLSELAVSGKGKVLPFDGFHPAAGEGTGFDPNSLPPPDLHTGAPLITGVTGLPKPAMFAALAFAAFGTLAFTVRRRRTQTAAFLSAMDRHYRS